MILAILSMIGVVMGLGLDLTTDTTNQTTGFVTPLDPLGQVMKQMQGDNKTNRPTEECGTLEPEPLIKKAYECSKNITQGR
jgi:hypothetical protein